MRLFLRLIAIILDLIGIIVYMHTAASYMPNVYLIF